MRGNSQIYTRDTRLPIPPRVMASSPWGSIWGRQVFADHTCKRRLRTNAFTIFVLCAACMHMTNHDYFDYGKNLKTPKLSPMKGANWHRVWYCWCTSVGQLQNTTAGWPRFTSSSEWSLCRKNRNWPELDLGPVVNKRLCIEVVSKIVKKIM